MRQMIQTRIERPINEIHQRLGHIEQAQREMDAKMDGLDKSDGTYRGPAGASKRLRRHDKEQA